MITKVKGGVISAVDILHAVSVDDLGAQNTDVTADINSNLLAGTAIFVPIGTWDITHLTVPDGGIIIGLGEGSILKLKDSANNIAISVGSNCYLKDFVIDGNKVNQGIGGCHGINLYGSTNTTLVGISVNNVKGIGVLVEGNCDELMLNIVKVSGYTEHGIKLANCSNVSLISPKVLASDVAATGDGIALMSDGGTVGNIQISNPVVRNAAGRGMSFIGNGSRNVNDVFINNPRVTGSGSHNIHMMSADNVTINGGLSESGLSDGVRLEGDVQNCKCLMLASKGNAGSGVRELVNGSTPNFNSFMYMLVSGNGNNAITKVGANSVIV